MENKININQMKEMVRGAISKKYGDKMIEIDKKVIEIQNKALQDKLILQKKLEEEIQTALDKLQESYLEKVKASLTKEEKEILNAVFKN